VDWITARLLVEYGPGTGTFTRRILERMRPDARLIAFEVDPDFCSFLRRTISDPRFHLFEESAANVHSILKRFEPGQADAVVSGIPFTTIPPELRIQIIQSTHSALRVGGRFLVYQFSGGVKPYLERSFGDVERGLEIRNLLPTRIFFCQRRLAPVSA
jgi:phospholipid N-methyltransferase